MELTSRRRLARVVLVVGIAAVAVHVLRTAPREVTVDVRFGAAHAGLRGATFTYSRAGEVVRTATFRYAAGAPDSQRHVVRLAPGTYDLAVELDLASGVRRSLHIFQAGGADAVRIDVEAER